MKTILLTTLVLLSSCANLGPNFETVKRAPKGKSLIYVYRPTAFTGSARSPDILFNGNKVGTAANGSYFSFEMDPGQANILQRNFAGEKTGEFNAQLKDENTYFLRVDLGIPTLKKSLDANGNTNGETCPFQGLNLTFRGQELEVLKAMDKRIQSRTCWPGFMFVTEDFAKRELSSTQLSK